MKIEAETKFKPGDTVFAIVPGRQEYYNEETCPRCLGKKKYDVTYPSGETASRRCDNCYGDGKIRGESHTRTVWEYYGSPEIKRIEIRVEGRRGKAETFYIVKALTRYRWSNSYREKTKALPERDCFETQAEADAEVKARNEKTKTNQEAER